MTINERINLLLKINHYSILYLSKETSLSNSTIKKIIKGDSTPNFIFLRFLFIQFPKLNTQWLFLGEGSMFLAEFELTKENEQNIFKEKVDIPINNIVDKKIKWKKLIGKAKTKDVIDELLDYLNDSNNQEIETNLINLKSTLSRMLDKSHNGIIESDEENKVINKINTILLYIIKDL